VRSVIHLYSSSMIIRQQIRGFTLSRIPEACTLYLQKEALPMMKPNSGVADTAIDRILNSRSMRTYKDGGRFGILRSFTI